MRTKTSELNGPALDWAVAMANGAALAVWRFNEFHAVGDMNYSTKWSHAGPIIEREGIRIHRSVTGAWWAGSEAEPQRPVSGLTPLIAAMRCYVASKLGDEIDVPEELI